MNKILVVGDTHFRSNLSFADYIDDKREPEEKEILDFIIKQANDCSTVVFLGDLMNSRTNPPEVIKKAVNFIEAFDGKELFILKGNHDDYGGKSTLDFLAEIKNKRWCIITNKIEEKNGMVFCPYFTKQELDEKTNEDATKKLIKMLPDGNILFVHHAISGSKSKEIPVSVFDEIVIPRLKLEKRYKQIFGGHVHTPSMINNIIIAGSIFTHDVNEINTYVWKLNTTTMEVEQIKLPGRAIYKLENPKLENLKKLDKSSIIKVVLTIKYDKKDMAELKDMLSEFDASMVIENIPTERRKLDIGKGTMLDFNIENLLQLYSKERNIPLEKLKAGFELIK